MKRAITLLALIALVGVLAANSVAAESHSFKLFREVSLNGTQLKPGNYKVTMNGNGEAVISRDGREVAKARAEIKPIDGGSSSGTVLTGANGELREIRLNGKVVVFVR
ncbi:MAG TPA: hypothetical protein VNN18_02415 [Candidatus Xenobia bacterium]|nr:hypothetical protein [Candidatus Xenobia bacterium]